MNTAWTWAECFYSFSSLGRHLLSNLFLVFPFYDTPRYPAHRLASG